MVWGSPGVPGVPVPAGELPARAAACAAAALSLGGAGGGGLTRSRWHISPARKSPTSWNPRNCKMG